MEPVANFRTGIPGNKLATVTGEKEPGGYGVMACLMSHVSKLQRAVTPWSSGVS